MATAVVVAHPDDETMWGAGFIMNNPCTVICCSVPRVDPIRAYNFFRACEVLGAKGRLMPFTESEPSQLLSLSVDLSEFDRVVTHNSKGEYGHLHHLQVSRYVREHFDGEIIHFGYGMDGEPIKYDKNLKLEALKCYDHMTRYRGELMPKWEALLDRYGDFEETYVSAS